MCQPIPQPVVDLIIAAGFDLRAEPCDPISHQTIGWTWTRAGLAPIRWHVKVGNFNVYRGDHGYGSGETARAALLDALASLAGHHDHNAKHQRAEEKRLRAERTKRLVLEAAESHEKKANDARALGASVAELWPEVTP